MRIAPAFLVSFALAALAACGEEDASRRLPPDTLIDEAPAALTNQTHARIAFRAGGVASHFVCALDGGAPSDCVSPLEVDVSEGSHTLAVTAMREALADATPAMTTWVVDTTPPDTAIASAPPALDNTAAPSVTFTGSDGGGQVHFECALDDAAFAACASPAALALPDGDHRFRVRAIDAAGNLDPTPAQASWRVDTTAPDTAFTTAPGPGATTAAQVSFAFGSPDAPVTFECALDGAAFAACTSPRAFTLADGPHTFAVRARDDAGLADPSPAARAWTVDATPPGVSITSAPADPTNQANGTVGFTSADPTATFTCRIDAGAFAACVTGVATGALADGAHTFTVRATDPVGNASVATASWTVDTVAPVVAVTPVAALTREPAPPVRFTVTGGATAIACRVDGGAFASCSSPFTPAALADGSHTITVRATDAAGNAGVGSTTFTVDTVAPTVVIDDAPPARWPTNYYDLAFHTDPGATLTCSLAGAAFAPCTSPRAITATYNVDTTFAVRATDQAGNVATATATWRAVDGLVLHYPWEQGQTHNTSLLAQRAAYSPDGTVTLTAVGGWAGAAAAAPAAHTYKDTLRPLSSSANGGYTASIWVRTAPNSNGGTVLSTLGASNGFSLSLAGRQVVLQVNDLGTPINVIGTIPVDQWVQLGVLTQGPGLGVQLLVNGVVVGTAAAPNVSGFGAGQAANLTVGQVFDVDLDDLRFYNRALAASELCTTLVRGQRDAQGACVPLTPGVELSFEGGVVRDTGRAGLPLSVPTQVAFVATKLGAGLRLPLPTQSFLYTQGFDGVVNAAPGHSFALWFVAGGTADTLFDFLHGCVAGAPFNCGIRASYGPDGLTVVASAGTAAQFTRTLPLGAGRHSLVVAERKAADRVTTQALLIYVDGVVTQLPVGSGNVFAQPPAALRLPGAAGTQLDEFELWPRDLSTDPEMLCENGWDGEWSPTTATCLLTAN